MKKRLSSISLILVLLLSMLTVTAWATDGANAETNVVSVKIGSTTTSYTNLQDAVTAAKGATGNVTITLLADVSISETLDLTEVTKLANIELNGYTLTADSCTALKIGGTGTVNIKGKTGTSHGEIKAVGDSVYAVEYVGTGILKFASYPTITGELRNSNNGTITINSGTFVGNIVNAGAGKITSAYTSYSAPEHTGELKNTGSGTIELEYGKFSEEPNEAFLVDQCAATKGTDNFWEVAMWTPEMAIEKGYVANSKVYTQKDYDKKTVYNGTYYKTLADAADARVAFYLISDVDLDNSGFEFTFGKRASNPSSRGIYLCGHTYTGSIKDESVAKSTSKANTFINGKSGTTLIKKTDEGRGTAKISKIDTVATLKVINNADVTVTTGTAAGINVDKSSTLTINGGTYTGTITVAEGGELTITDGTYDEDVTKYCAEGYIANKDKNGKYIVDKIPEKVVNADLDTDIKQGEPDVKVDENITDKESATAVASSVKANLTETKAAKNITVSDADKKNAIQKLVADKQIKLDEDGNIVPYDDSAASKDVKITIIEEPYVEVEVKALTVNQETGTSELTLDITPKYNLLATTDPDEKAENTVTVSTGNALTVNEKTDVKIELPSGFADSGDKLLVKHEKDDGSVEYYTGSVSDDGQGKLYLSFTTNGFTPFSVTNDYAASIGEGANKQVYVSLQSAVDAVKNGETIKLNKDGQTAEVKRTVSFIVDPSYTDKEGLKKSYNYTITLGDRCIRNTTENENEWDIIYTAPVKTKSPATADESTPGIFAVAGLISAVGVALLLRRKQSM